MTVTALQAFRIEGVEVILGRVDLSPLAGGEPGKKSRAIIETVSITFEEGMVVDDLLPGYWSIRDFATPPQDHARLSLRYEGVYRLDTFDIEVKDFPLVIPGLLRVGK